MVQLINKIKNKKAQIKKDSTFWMSIFIIGLMVLSVLGFALGSGGTRGSSGDSPSEVEFQQFENEGQIFWGAIKNNEQFIFLDIEGFDQDIVMSSLANKIKQQQEIDLYIDKNFTSSDSVYLIEKSLRGLNIKYKRTTNNECKENTLILTTNQTIQGNCMKFISNNEESYKKIEVLTYHLVQ